MIRHVVLLRFKDEASGSRRADIASSFAALADEVPMVQSLEWGVNAGPEGLDKGFTHCFVVTFATEADRDAYIPHPAHRAFVEKSQAWLADVLVVDYDPSSAR